MRWFWIDRFLEFERAKRAVAIKNISLAEDYLTDYMPGYPVFPQALVVEGLAQTGGLLAGEVNGFRERVVLAKITRATFHEFAWPGDLLTYRIYGVAWDPDGEHAVLATEGGLVRVNPATGVATPLANPPSERAVYAVDSGRGVAVAG